MEKFKLVPWEDRSGATGRFILRLPYSDISLIVDEVGKLVSKPAALLPPHESDQNFTARCAAVARDKFPEHKVMVAVGRSNRKESESFLRVLVSGEFDAFALPVDIGGNYTLHLAGFWDAARLLQPSCWYHICGMSLPLVHSLEPTSARTGEWTWGEEEL